jgi:hypothetical protein
MTDTHSSPGRESRWKTLLDRNIGWIVIAAAIWLTHFHQILGQ